MSEFRDFLKENRTNMEMCRNVCQFCKILFLKFVKFGKKKVGADRSGPASPPIGSQPRRLIPDKKGLPAGTYHFELEAQNPSETKLDLTPS